MSFLSNIVADLKASATKAVANVYTANLDKAEQAASKLFTTMKVAEGADLKNETIPAAAAPQGVNAPLPSMPAPMQKPNYAAAALLVVVAFVAWLIFKE